MTIPIESPPSNIEKLAEMLKVLSEPKRLLLFHLLMEGVQCNCELSEAIDAAPNLISHHLRVLRESGLIDVEQDPIDARWLYYSINPQALEELNRSFGLFFAPERIKPRHLSCGPQGFLMSADTNQQAKR